MNQWKGFELQKLIKDVIEYEHTYYCQIHSMKESIMQYEHLSLFIPEIENRFMPLVETSLNKHLSDVKEAIQRSHTYFCLSTKMNRGHMYPDEIMSHIEGLIRMKPYDAFKNIESVKNKLFAEKLNNELPKNTGVEEKPIKI